MYLSVHSVSPELVAPPLNRNALSRAWTTFPLLIKISFSPFSFLSRSSFLNLYCSSLCIFVWSGPINTFSYSGLSFRVLDFFRICFFTCVLCTLTFVSLVVSGALFPILTQFSTVSSSSTSIDFSISLILLRSSFFLISTSSSLILGDSGS